MRQQDAAHGAQRLLRRYIERRSLFNRISDVGIEPAVVSSFRLYPASFPTHACQGPPPCFWFLAPVRSPGRPARAILASQNLLLRVHSILHKRSFRAVNQEMWPRSIRDNPCAQHRPQTRIFHVHIKGIVDLRNLALTVGRRPNRLGLAKQNQRLVDQVRPQIPKNASRRRVRALPPRVRLGLQPKTVEASLVLGDRAHLARFQQLLERLKISVPAPVLIHRDQASAIGGDTH